ncbi:DUF3810 domain-containing protein [Ornithobacterium rhinotracheale]|uniref:DUF3810 domain-containing protein n=1 Tax=Ornithobacterium rhinotracheale TaxID=28251 RepID=A0A3R5X0I7_ORNRH|nr:DUF3810 domain-containing protein [Ornithobacterium rhinotracheale]
MMGNLKKLKGLYFWLIIYLIIWALKHSEFFTQSLYTQWYAFFYPLYTRAFGWVFFSVGDFVYLFVALFLIQFIYCGLKLMVQRNGQWLHFLNKMLWLTGLMYASFHFLWAFNYYKKPIFEEMRPADTTELKIIANDILAKTKAQSQWVPRKPSGEMLFVPQAFNSLIQDSIQGLHALNLPFREMPKRRKKNSIYSFAMRYMGVSGYYNPFTAEAQITQGLPSVSQPFTMAHEQAHQMGYAFESEANFVGYLACVQSPSPALRYAANYKALRYVLRAIYPKDSMFVKEKIRAYSPGMQADYQAELDYFNKYNSAADKVFSAMNHQYLKANNQAEGLESYGKFVALLVEYYRLQKP